MRFPSRAELKDIDWLFKGLFGLLGLFMLTMLVLFIVLQRYHASARHLATQIEQARNLGLELQQSSNDLTRFVRFYALTGDPRYESYYYAIIAIRDGRLPHPSQFSLMYWDFVAAGTQAMDQGGDTYSIQKRLLQLDLEQSERELLLHAKAESDALIIIEQTAINAIKGLFRDKNGLFTRHGPPDARIAQQLLYSNGYMETKARIMAPIEQFFQRLESRSASESVRLQRLQISLHRTLIVAALLFIALAAYTFGKFRRRVMVPLDEMEKAVGELASGHLGYRVKLEGEDEFGRLAQDFNHMASTLQEQTARLRSIFNASRDGLIFTDMHGDIIECSPAAGQLLGYRPEDLTGHSISMLMPDDTAEKFQTHLSQYLTGETSRFVGRTRQVRVRGKDEREIPVELTLNELLILDRRYFIASIKDVSVHVEMATSLQETQFRYQRLVEEISGKFMLFSHEYNGTLAFVSDGFESLFGINKTAAVGHRWQEIVRWLPGMEKRAEEALAQLRDPQNGVVSFELDFRHADGSIRTLLISEHAVHDAEGRIKTVDGIAEDVTDRKRYEAEMANARDLALDASRAKSAFLASMNHEFRTPLNAIIGFAQILEYDDLQPHQLEAVQSIQHSGQTLLEIINEVLELAEIEAGRVSLGLEPTALFSLVSEAVQDPHAAAEVRRIHLIHVCSGRFQVHANPQRLLRILKNLIANAIKYNREGGRISVSCRPRDSWLRISVSDSGIGISSEQQNNVFQPFDRLGMENSNIQGAGIGLAISKRIIEAMGGTIGFDSTEGSGSIFWIELPLANETAHILPEPH